MSELPKGWVEVSLGDVTTKPQYGYTTKSQSHGSVQYLRTTDLTSGSINWSTVPFCVNEPSDINKYQLEANDIVISRAGSVGFHSLITSPPKNSVFASYLIRFKPLETINERYLSHFLKSKAYWDQITKHSAGVAVQNVNAKKLATLRLPLAPLNEQKRIADKLDSILAKVDKAQTRLEKIPTILKRFRQSVLAAATSGELTKEWRKENPLASINEILNDISGITFDKRTQKLVQKPFFDTEINKPIPDTWKWLRLCAISDVVSGIAKGSKIKEETTLLPYLRVANVQRGYLDLSEIKYINVAKTKADKLRLKKGDVLFNEGGDIDKLGRGWIWEEQVENCIHQNHVFRARVLTDRIQPKYLSYYGNETAREYFLRGGTQTVNLANLNKTTLSLLPVPLPPAEEQLEIVRRVDELLFSADRVEKEYENAIFKIDRLTQSILAKAFRGELVTQDENDESADLLLEKIRKSKSTKNASVIRRKNETDKN